MHNAFRKMLIKMQSNLNNSVSVLQSHRITEIHHPDGGKEYGKVEIDFGETSGIKNSFFPPYTLELNGIAE